MKSATRDRRMALLNGSSTRRMVFPHIMKTAGTSLISWIQRHYAYHEILLAATTWPELLRLPRGSLVGKKFVRGHFGSAIMKLFGEDKGDRKSTRLNSSHVEISYAVFCLKKKKKK